MIRLLDFISELVRLYEIVVIVTVVMSWLIAYGAIKPYDPRIRAFMQGINAVTEPLLRPIRRLLPNMGGLDLSPLLLWLGCRFVRFVVIEHLKDKFG